MDLPISRYLRCFRSYVSHGTVLKRLRSFVTRSLSSWGSFGFLRPAKNKKLHLSRNRWGQSVYRPGYASQSFLGYNCLAGHEAHAAGRGSENI